MMSRLSVLDYALTVTLLAGLTIGRRLDGYSCTEQCAWKRTAPVCGSNGINYRNPCMLNAYNCQYKNAEDKVAKLFDGHCNTDPTPEKCGIRCPRKKGQICGSDRLTYESYCDLIMNNCRTKSYVQTVARGPCPSSKPVVFDTTLV